MNTLELLESSSKKMTRRIWVCVAVFFFSSLAIVAFYKYNIKIGMYVAGAVACVTLIGMLVLAPLLQTRVKCPACSKPLSWIYEQTQSNILEKAVSVKYCYFCGHDLTIELKKNEQSESAKE